MSFTIRLNASWVKIYSFRSKWVTSYANIGVTFKTHSDSLHDSLDFSLLLNLYRLLELRSEFLKKAIWRLIEFCPLTWEPSIVITGDWFKFIWVAFIFVYFYWSSPSKTSSYLNFFVSRSLWLRSKKHDFLTFPLKISRLWRFSAI